ncbi:hypothetical protein [Paraburkholderia solisilvae]|uniref:DUF1521 domain-containing protein n=1 Tax=Paraburkholderia solisilvae TaxID=624376 RepID=A0A6J5DTI7_9BURK|nr:hypothetical protein [Paraburkholderia solisilvae]CAB3756814.1 hypothetical protein LMG29739_02542 [Paraburkholderia solisilvae]
MQATFDSRSFETLHNNAWNSARSVTQSRSFDSFAASSRSINPYGASRAFSQPSGYPQTSRAMASFSSHAYSTPQRSDYGRMQQASMTNFSREVVRTPDGGMMSKTSFTRVQQPANQRDYGHDRHGYDNGSDRHGRDIDERCWNNRSGQTSHLPMSVTSKGDDLNVRMGNNTTLETKKSDSDLFINTKTKDGHDVSISSKGDPHASLSVDGKQIATGDYKDPFRVQVDGNNITMIPEAKKNNNGPAPYLDKAVIQQKDGSMYVMDHLSQADKSSKPTYREVTNGSEKSQYQQIANNAHTATYSNGQMIDSTTHKPITNADINAH